MRASHVLIVSLVLALAACSDDKGLRVLSSSGEGPDEFQVVAGKPLTQPKDYAALPTPTPGQGNITDQDPMGDAVAALGGSAARRNDTTGIGSSDGALVSYTSRQGRQVGIRTTLSEEDADFRKGRSRFTNIRIVKKDLYNEVYKRESLETYPEWWRWRQAGAKTPAAPPPGGG